MSVLIPDILRAIFETAAREDGRSALNLALVSRCVRNWVEIVLYSTVRLSRQRTTNNFLRTIETSHDKPGCYFSIHVKSLSIVYDMPVDQIRRIGQICSGIQNLTTWFISTERLPLAQCLSEVGVRPKRLAAWHGVLCSPDPHLNLPFFTQLTHLTVVNIWEQWSTWPHLDSSGFTLPNLTHLSLDLTFGARVLASWEVLAITDAVLAFLDFQSLRICGLRVDQPAESPTLVAVAARLADEERVVLYRHGEPFQVREAHSDKEGKIWGALEQVVVRGSSARKGEVFFVI
ncbi:hypothetical protein FB45DRAFT_1121425 [Roridomyces roridus]|uniref:Uncharacterized protein n=1 Tax=Roridomyces roridus TaxID=1738132 RepID=A0AAD7B4G3_9AGAR|nr:hypothetical protein FB45DRAFT_1121425 [Roridomyces roridus]